MPPTESDPRPEPEAQECFLAQNESSKGLVLTDLSSTTVNDVPENDGSNSCFGRPTLVQSDLETVPKLACRNIPVIITASLENAFYK